MKKELKKRIQTIKIYSQDIEMKFCFEKRAMLIMKKRKREITEEKQVRNKENIRTLEKKENYKYLGISEGDIIKEREIKEKIRKEFL